MSVLSQLGSFSSKYRTSVLYDFSIVKKAAFYLYHRTETTSGWTRINEPTIYLQINPTELSAKSFTPNLGEKRKSLVGTEKANFPGGGPEYKNEELGIKLIYDVYDEYMVGTCDGMLQGTQTYTRDLTSTTHLSLQRLIDISKDLNHAVLFKWGPIEFFGLIQSIDFNYTAFSRFGEPLKGDGSMKLERVGTTYNSDGEATNFEDKAGLIDVAGLDAKTTAENVILRSAVAAELAGTETLGSLGSLRSFFD